MTALSVTARIAWSRVGVAFAGSSVAVALVAIAGAAWVERRVSASSAADHTLLGVVFGLALPLLAYVAASRVVRGGRLDDAVASLARHGMSRRRAALSLVVTLMIGLAVVGVLLAMWGVAVARGVGDPRLASDAVTSGWIGALAGVAYAALFAVGSSFGRKGGGRFVVLAADWLVGSTTTVAAAGLPRGHLRNLLGAEQLVGLSQPQALGVLGALCVVYVVLSVGRMPR